MFFVWKIIIQICHFIIWIIAKATWATQPAPMEHHIEQLLIQWDAVERQSHLQSLLVSVLKFNNYFLVWWTCTFSLKIYFIVKQDFTSLLASKFIMYMFTPGSCPCANIYLYFHIILVNFYKNKYFQPNLFYIWSISCSSNLLILISL